MQVIDILADNQVIMQVAVMKNAAAEITPALLFIPGSQTHKLRSSTFKTKCWELIETDLRGILDTRPDGPSAIVCLKLCSAAQHHFWDTPISDAYQDFAGRVLRDDWNHKEQPGSTRCDKTFTRLCHTQKSLSLITTAGRILEILQKSIGWESAVAVGQSAGCLSWLTLLETLDPGEFKVTHLCLQNPYFCECKTLDMAADQDRASVACRLNPVHQSSLVASSELDVSLLYDTKDETSGSHSVKRFHEDLSVIHQKLFIDVVYRGPHEVCRESMMKWWKHTLVLHRTQEAQRIINRPQSSSSSTAATGSLSPELQTLSAEIHRREQHWQELPEAFRSGELESIRNLEQAFYSTLYPGDHRGIRSLLHRRQGNRRRGHPNSPPRGDKSAPKAPSRGNKEKQRMRIVRWTFCRYMGASLPF